MKEISLEDDKKIGLETLIYLDNFCKLHNLKYQIAYGSLIGAVRHEGYIPWDDDIDIWMHREDYDKLLTLSTELENERYVLNAIELNSKFQFPFAKLTRKDTVLLPSRFTNGFMYGASIDIFPLDYVGHTGSYEQVKREYLELRNRYQVTINKYYAYTGGVKANIIKETIKKALYCLANVYYGSFDKHILEYSRMLIEDNHIMPSKYVATVAGETVYKREWFEQTIEMKFENIMVPAPAMYDEILRCRYGDYMQLPPEKERVLPHSFQVYYLDT